MSSPDQPVQTPDGISREESITRRAYERFQMRGSEHGRDLEDWFEAEHEVGQNRQE
jgi:hypothetical protein